MNQQLRNALERVGWDSLYERHIDGLAQPNQQGERHGRSPFPDTHDTHPSFSVNTVTGAWSCFSSGRSGNYVMFRALVDATEFDDTGHVIPDYREAEQTILEEVGLAVPVDPHWLVQCRDALQHPAALLQVQARKPWTAATLRDLNVGYDQDSNRLVFPVQDRRGRVLNCRLYMPGGQPKFLWYIEGAAANTPWPHQAWLDDVLILVEGEPDALTLRSLGFPGVSGHMGASAILPEGMWWRGRRVYCLPDLDEVGDQAMRAAAETLAGSGASEVSWINLPRWDGAPDNGDVSDFVAWLLSSGSSREDATRAIAELIRDAVPVLAAHSDLDMEAIDTTFVDALSSANLGRRVSFPARVTARSEQRYMLPVRYRLTCPATGHTYCARCPMRNEFHGAGEFVHDPRSRGTLGLVQVSDREQLDQAKRDQHIPQQCPDPNMTILGTVDVEPVIINESLTVGTTDAGQAERHRREAYLVLPPGIRVEEARDYQMVGYPWPTPKSQAAVFIVNHADPIATEWDEFDPADHLHLLAAYRPSPGQDVLSKIMHVAEDLAASVTLIRGRPDLHAAYLAVWHSLLAFDLGGEPVERGWVECLVIGDTRCGKSVAFRRLAEWYGVGAHIDCKMQSVAGVLGSVVQSPQTGERYVVAGILPQQDGRVVCFDEFHTERTGTRNLIEALSSTRSEGVVRISKAASAVFRARVRAIWLANPGLGELMSEAGLTGVEMIQRLIPQPEDIARFDMAVAVAMTDVPIEVVAAVVAPATPVYPQEGARALLRWAYSRQPHQARFTPEGAAAVTTAAMAMAEKYDRSVPLVEPADQRTRIAKLAISMAAATFAHAPGDPNILEAGAEHVEAARRLLEWGYDKPAMGYNAYSQRAAEDRSLVDPETVLRIFTELAAPHGRRLAEEVMRADLLTIRNLAAMVPSAALSLASQEAIQSLQANRAIRLVQRNGRDGYRPTPALRQLLRQWMASDE
jgi:hypothetical protein